MRYAAEMVGFVQLTRPQRRAPVMRAIVRPGALPRMVARSDVVVRRRPEFEQPGSPAPDRRVQPDPYVDYGRFLTPEGGILIVYKDLDLRLRHTLWRVFAWSSFTGLEAWFVLYHSSVQSLWVNLACLLAMAIINWLIVCEPVETYREIEIRPDCLILEGREIFWRRFMENGWPTFRPDIEGNQILCGVYGTRWVEYLTVRRFDELDRMPEVFTAGLHDAMMQLWTRILS